MLYKYLRITYVSTEKIERNKKISIAQKSKNKKKENIKTENNK